MRAIVTGVLSLAAAVSALGAGHVGPDGVVRYDGDLAVSVLVRSNADLDVIRATEAVLLSESEALGPVEYVVSPADREALEAAGLALRVIERDVGAAMRLERERIARAARVDARDDAWFADYKDLAQITAFLDGLVADHGDVVSRATIALSVEGRPIDAFTLTAPGGDPASKPALLFNFTQHAREWISPMTGLYIMERLASGYGVDPAVTELLDGLTVYFVPMVNPDGYEYSWTNNRLWRKNRRDNLNGTFGVDLNRNWSVGFGGPGASPLTQDILYHGPSAFSEPETDGLRAFAESNANIIAHIDFHSYSQLVLWPYGYENTEPAEPDRSVLVALGQDFAAEIFEETGEVYVPEAVHDLTIASGIATDWAYDAAGLLSWTVELRPATQFEGGFLLDASEILPTCRENHAAVLGLARSVLDGVLFRFPEGVPPQTVEAGLPTDLDGTVLAVSSAAIDPSSAATFSRLAGTTEFVETPGAALGGSGVRFTLPAGDCDGVIEYYLAIDDTAGAAYTWPPDAPASLLTAQVANAGQAIDDPFESDLGWTAGAPGDTATTGAWTRVDPVQTTSNGAVVQPGDDVSPTGALCWVTDGRGGQAGTYDVDGGVTTLLSPVLDLAGVQGATVSYWRWFSNDAGGAPNEDVFRVDVSSDGGQSWTPLEVVGPVGEGTSGGWIFAQHDLDGVVALSSQVRFRFIAADEGEPSLVEAAIDDFFVAVALDCPTCPGDLDGDGEVLLPDLGIFATLFGSTVAPGSTGDLNGDGEVTLADFGILASAFGTPCGS